MRPCRRTVQNCCGPFTRRLNDRNSAFRRAGFGDAHIVEIVASVVVGCFTNFLNNVAQTALDIPEAKPLVGHAA